MMTVCSLPQCIWTVQHFVGIKVSSLSPGFLKSTFISGLKARIRRAVVAQILRDFHDAFALARVFKEQFAEERFINRPWNFKLNSPTFNSAVSLNQQLPTSTTTDKLPIRRLSPAEIQLYRERVLCYNCDEKFVIGHRCKGKSTLLYLEGLDDDIENDQPPEDTPLSDPKLATMLCLDNVLPNLLGYKVQLTQLRYKF
ncbi:hypothetical protein Pint_02410 [Pistacia integerrima]|uniref:Uncharacterized protein n=1 Tax=Pistacia integerrima TaxID=434235 RepID=A0ACC0ZN20_9ROSI|nr:hypothetical protein Pint_02410 [Pistacia integerrima]